METHVLPLQFYTAESLEFQERISQRNGLGNDTYFPPSLHQEPPNCNMDTAREEAELVLFGVVEEVLQKTGEASQLLSVLHPRMIGARRFQCISSVCSVL